MRPIDADLLQTALMDEYVGIAGYNTRTQFYRAIEIVRQQPTITPPPNDPLTLEELREMAWSQSPVWCSDIDGVHAGLLCIRDEWCTSERTPHIWVLDEEGHSGVYSIESLVKCGSRFYRRKPEEGTT